MTSNHSDVKAVGVAGVPILDTWQAESAEGNGHRRSRFGGPVVYAAAGLRASTMPCVVLAPRPTGNEEVFNRVLRALNVHLVHQGQTVKMAQSVMHCGPRGIHRRIHFDDQTGRTDVKAFFSQAIDYPLSWLLINPAGQPYGNADESRFWRSSLEWARSNKVPTMLDLASVHRCRHDHALISAIEAQMADIVIGTREEFSALGISAKNLARSMRGISAFEIACVEKRNKNGLAMYGKSIELELRPPEIIDIPELVGAGDVLAAVLSASLCKGLDTKVAARMAMEVVCHIARPHACWTFPFAVPAKMIEDL